MNEYFNPGIKVLIMTRVRLGEFWNFPDLSAPYWRLYWNSGEGASVWLDGREHPLLPSEIMLISPDTHFSSACRGGPEHFYIHFTVSLPFANIASRITRISPGSEILRIISETARHVSPGKNVTADVSMAAQMLILYALRSVPLALPHGRGMDPRITAAMKMIDEDISSPLTNEEIARKLSMSTNAFLRLFKENAGTSPQLYSRTKRVEKACILLHFSGMDIKQIASETGFCDRFHFSRVFRKLRGVGPSEFRKRVH